MLSLLFFSSTVTAENQVNNDPPQLIIDLDHGSNINDNLSLTGAYVDESVPEIFIWKIYDGTSIVGSGDAIDILDHHEEVLGSSRYTWPFSIELNFSEIESCSCLIVIEATDTSQQHVSEEVVVFHTVNSSDNLPPRALFGNDLSESRVSGFEEINVILVDDEGPPNLEWALSNESEVAVSCALSWIDNPSVNWSYVDHSEIFPDLAFTLDTTEFSDGAYSLLIRASTENESSISACQTIGIDNHLPTASISGPTELTESMDMIEFDGSSSSDEEWGREGLIFLWVLEGGDEGPIVVSGTDLSIFQADGSQAGNYTLTLTVVDDAGFSSSIIHEYSILNQVPDAALRIGGQPLSDGDRITLVDSDQWSIECGDSADTDNDRGSLLCTWSIDGEPTMTGWTRQLEKPADLTRSHTLTLLVTDNDGASDSITVTFGVQGTPSDPSYSEDKHEFGVWTSALIIIATISAIIIIIITIKRRISDHSSPIPKWNRE